MFNCYYHRQLEVEIRTISNPDEILCILKVSAIGNPYFEDLAIASHLLLNSYNYSLTNKIRQKAQKAYADKITYPVE